MESLALYPLLLKRRKYYKPLVGIIVLLILGAISALAYRARAENSFSFHLARQLFVIPIIITAFTFESTLASLLALVITSLYIPLQVSLFQTTGFSADSVELFADLVSYNLFAALIAGPVQFRFRHRGLREAVEGLGQVIASSRDTRLLFSRVLMHSMQLCNADEGDILLLQDGGIVVSSLVHRTVLKRARAAEGQGSTDLTLLEWLIQRGQMTALANFSDDPRFELPADIARQRIALLALPLRRDRELAGIMVLWNFRDRRFSPTEVDLLRVLADKSQMAIENAWLYSQTDAALSKRTFELSMLLEASSTFSSSRDLDQLLQVLCQKTAELAESVFCRIYLFDDEDQVRFRIRASYAIRRSEWNAEVGRAFEADELPWHQAATQGNQPIVLMREDPEVREPEHSLLFGQACRFALLVPLVVKDRCLGVVALSEMRSWERRPFDDERIELCRAIARQAALAIENIRAYESIAYEKERFESFIDNLAEGVLTVNAQGIITSFNPAAEKITGYVADQAVGGRCVDLFHAPSNGGSALSVLDAPLEQFSVLSMSGEPIQSKEWIIRDDGTKIQVALSISPLRDPSGRLVGAISLLRDISREEELTRMKSEFISLVSHELRTPLTSISAAIQLLVDADLQRPAKRAMLETVNGECKRLVRLVEHVLESSRLERGQIDLTLEPLALMPLIEQASNMYRTQNGNRRLEIKVTDPSLFALGDLVSVEVVLGNLLNNAVNYSAPGSTITIGADDCGDHVLISVKDQGRGIAADQLERVFERFHRVPTTPSGKASGFGLGLYISRMLVEAQGGKIWAESEPGRGSCFSFTLRKLEPGDEKENPGY